MSNKNFISPSEVKNLLHSSNNVLLVDIRAENEYSDWNIKGSMNVPVNPFLVSGDVVQMKKMLSELPKDKHIVTICMRGINSQVAASMLREMNYKASTLEKGMKGWNENFDIHEIDFDSFKVIQFIRIGKGCLSYIVQCKQTNESAVFEPSIFTDEYLAYIKEHSLKPKYVIDTHSHADHFSGAMALAEKLGVDYYVNATDFDGGFKNKNLNGVDSLTLGNIEIKIFQTPGHTDGSLSFLINNEALICGDLLLLESVGRPDLARSSEQTVEGAKKLYTTLQEIILKLDGNVIIFPSHFTKTDKRPVCMTLKDLGKYNDSLLINDKEQFIQFITEHIPNTPPNYESIKKYNKAGVVVPMDYAEDLEIGPNRCAAR